MRYDYWSVIFLFNINIGHEVVSKVLFHAETPGMTIRMFSH